LDPPPRVGGGAAPGGVEGSPAAEVLLPPVVDPGATGELGYGAAGSGGVGAAAREAPDVHQEFDPGPGEQRGQLFAVQAPVSDGEQHQSVAPFRPWASSRRSRPGRRRVAATITPPTIRPESAAHTVLTSHPRIAPTPGTPAAGSARR